MGIMIFIIKFKHLIRDDKKSSRMDLKTICLGQTLNTISKDLSASHLILGKTHFPLIRYFSIDNFSLRRQVSILERKNANRGTLKDFYFLLFFRMAGDIMQPWYRRQLNLKSWKNIIPKYDVLFHVYITVWAKKAYSGTVLRAHRQLTFHFPL